MKRVFTATLAAGMVAILASSASFAADPTVDQIYSAANSGHLDQAQQMITEVLAAHPQSARAHFVQSELYAREGKTALARSEFGAAERLNPGLSFANPRAVAELKAQLGLRSAGTPVGLRQVPAPARFPWGAVLFVIAAIALLLMVFRRRPTYAQYPVAGPGPGGAAGGYGPGYPGYGPAPMGGGMGSGIAGGLASGLAVGAGVVAGEELAHHFLDGRSGGAVIPSAEAADPGVSNADMGGNDFGLSDPGAGWDDGGGGGGFDGGGGDWS